MAAKKNSKKKVQGARGPASGDVDVKVDAALKRQYDELVAVIADAKGKGAKLFDVLWEAAGEIVDKKLFFVGGHGTAKEFYLKVCGEEDRTARRWVRVAKWATPTEEEDYGVTMLDAAIGYLIAVNGGQEPERHIPVDFSKLRIPVEREGVTVRLPLDQLEPQEVDRATGKLRDGPGSTGPKSEVRDRIKAKFAKSRALSEVTVRESAGLASFNGVPVGSFKVFGETIARINVFPDKKQAKKPAAKKGAAKKKPAKKKPPTKR